MNKRDNILNAAIYIFSQVGYHNAKISDIAEKANIATGTTYLYFKSKEQILEEVFIKSWSNIENCLLELINKKKISASDKLKLLVDTLVDLIAKNKEIARLILFEERFWRSGDSERVSNMLNNTKKMLSDIIKSGVKNNDFRKNINPIFATNYIIGGLWYIMTYWSENFEEIKIENIKKETYKLVLKGLE